jgi:hypothetical protein
LQCAIEFCQPLRTNDAQNVQNGIAKICGILFFSAWVMLQLLK